MARRASDRGDLIGGLAGTAFCTVGLIARTICIIARAMFLVGLVSPTKSFIGSPGPLKTWQWLQVTPSAAVKFCMAWTTCGARMSFGNTCRFCSGGCGAPPPRAGS